MSDCRQCADFDWCKENEECGLFKPKTMTNADRIRAMTDKELAEYMGDVQMFGGCPNHGARDCVEDCADCWLKWLKEEGE